MRSRYRREFRSRVRDDALRKRKAEPWRETLDQPHDLPPGRYDDDRPVARDLIDDLNREYADVHRPHALEEALRRGSLLRFREVALEDPIPAARKYWCPDHPGAQHADPHPEPRRLDAEPLR